MASHLNFLLLSVQISGPLILGPSFWFYLLFVCLVPLRCDSFFFNPTILNFVCLFVLNE